MSRFAGVSVVNLLFRQAPNRVFLSIMLDAIAGMAYAMIIPLVLGSMRVDDGAVMPFTVLGFEVANHRYALMFVTVVIFILGTSAISKIIMERVAANVASELRLDICERLARASVAAVERAGPGRIMAVLSEDMPSIVAAGRLFPALLSNLATLMGMLAYLAYLNFGAFWLVLKAIAVGVLTYQVPILIGMRFVKRRREYVGKLHHALRALLDGFKELKLDHRKRSAFFQGYLQANEFGVRDAAKAGHVILSLAETYGELVNFFVIGVVSFIFINYHAISTQELIAVVMTLLYVTAPVSFILQSLPRYATARVSLKKVRELFEQMPQETARPVYAPALPWSRIRFDEVVYRYPAGESNDGYTVGPVSFDVCRNEITFIVGGNGSGKSTLSKLLTLHYAADAGSIYFDDIKISDETLNVFRQQIAFIYSDYYVFDRLLAKSDRISKAEIDRYLLELGLASKVRFENGEFSSLRLSDGQKRRMAMLVAFAEDKELYLFDEWAADQDPAFKDVFYYEIVPALRRNGKAVVVVSHDDRYFHVADRLLFMESGRLVADSSVAISDRRVAAMHGPIQL
jgi:putative ATP-binding cassette transporter